jgi:hypothetical protein
MSISEMQFEKLEQSIIDNVLVPAEMDRYVTIGAQRQRRSAQVINNDRQVTVYYSEGEMPKSAGASYGGVMHHITFIIEFAVVAAAKVDLATLKSETATASEKATALRQLSEASVIANRSMNELIRIVFQVVMDNRNADLGMGKGQVSSRFVSQIRKDNPVPDGEFMALTGSARLTCSVAEEITGADLPDAADPAVFDNTIDLDGDDTEKTGVEIQNTP